MTTRTTEEASMSDTTRQDESSQRERALQIARDARFCMVTSQDATGDLHARPMTPQEVEDDGTIWLFIARSTEQARDITARPSVNLSFSSSSEWLSLAGRAEVVDDRARIERLWDAASEAWFPDGPSDPDLALLRVSGASAEYWAAPGGKVATLFSFVKAKATGETMDAENEQVDL